MKHRLFLRIGSLLTFLLTLAWSLLNVSCTDSETTDDTEFALYYAGVTDIGPSMNFTLDAPTYKGAAPSDFTITGVKLDGSSVETSSFTVDAATGAIHIENTSSLAVGTYTLDVACNSGGNHYSFSDIVTINMMKPVPDGITVEPNLLTVDYADVIGGAASLPTAQVTTDGNHISIKKYLIANVRKDEALVKDNNFFKISNAGLISIVPGKTNIEPGVYVLDLKLTTAVAGEDSEEGIFTNAVTINVTSKPLGLTYTPAQNSVEVNATEAVTSSVPELFGSPEGLTYKLKSVTPANAPVSVDSKTGTVTMAGNHGLAVNTVVKVSVTATNKYGSADFDDVYTFNIVPFIAPITKFAYGDKADVIQGVAFSNKVAEMDGAEVQYSFVDKDTKLAELKINPSTGEVYADKGNSIPLGTYTVKVLAKNAKGQKEASFKLEIVKNKYYFTYVHWGNNLGLTPARNYASQYRTTETGFEISVKESDIPSGVEAQYSIASRSDSKLTAEIDAQTGKLTISGYNGKNVKVYMVLVKVVTGKGTAGETSITVPVFINYSAPVNGVTITYTPFVFQVNPQKGGTSVAPKVEGADASKLQMDYRRSFSYTNLNGPASHISGNLNETSTNTFIYSMWKSYYGDGPVKAGEKNPMSYYKNESGLAAALGYVNATKGCAVTINPGKWQDEAGYANGVFMGQMTFLTTGNATNEDINASKNTIFPIAIWFDTKF